MPGEPLLKAVRRRLWDSDDAARWFTDSALHWAMVEAMLRPSRTLFWTECHIARDESYWPVERRRFTEQWFGLSVCVLSDGNFEGVPYVGVCLGVQKGMLGAAVCIAQFGTHGSTTHVSPRGMYDIFELCEDFREPPGRWDDDDEG